VPLHHLVRYVILTLGYDVSYVYMGGSGEIRVTTWSEESPLRPAMVLDALYDLEPLALLHGEPYRIGRLENCWGFPLVSLLPLAAAPSP